MPVNGVTSRMTISRCPFQAAPSKKRFKAGKMADPVLDAVLARRDALRARFSVQCSVSVWRKIRICELLLLELAAVPALSQSLKPQFDPLITLLGLLDEQGQLSPMVRLLDHLMN